MSELYNMRSTQNDVNSLENLISLVYGKKNDKLTMVEIGSYQGQSMELFVKTGRVKTIACIDPWKMGYDPRDEASYTDMNKVEAMFDLRAETLKNAVTIIKHKGTVDTFVNSDDFKKLADTGIDLVYIDACHTYDACKHDIAVVKATICPKIAIAGHDFTNYWIGVKTAVTESMGQPDCIFSDTSWLKCIK